MDSDREDHRDLGAALGREADETSGLLGHYYRGELDRANSWAVRLDETTKWSVTVVAAILTWVFSSPKNPHYILLLGMATVAAKDRHGSDVEDRQAAMDEYADMARQLDLDEYVDDYVAMHGGPDELSPGQAIVVFSVVFGASVMVEDPELSESVLEGVGA